MHSHLVAVEVGVERTADKRADLDGSALDQNGLERLNGQTVQRGRTVEEHGVFLDDVFKDVPDEVLALFHGALCALDVVALARLDKALHDEGLEELDCHLLGKTALVDLQLRSDDDDRTARIVDTLAEQVLTETALFAAQKSGQGLELAVGGTRERLAAAAVIDEGVHRFLKHALLVLDDHLGRAQLDHALQAVVAVDDAAVQIVEVAGCESAAVQLNHRAQIGRNDGKHREDHPFGLVAALSECLDDLDALDRFDALGARRVALDDLLRLLALFVEVDCLQKFTDRLRAHAHFEARDGGLADEFLDVAHLSVVDDLLVGDALVLELHDSFPGLGICHGARLHELCRALEDRIGLAVLGSAFLEGVQLDSVSAAHLLKERLHLVRRLHRRGRDVVDVVEIVRRAQKGFLCRELARKRFGVCLLHVRLGGLAREGSNFLDFGKSDNGSVVLAAEHIECAVIEKNGNFIEVARIEHRVCRKVDDLLERLGTHIEQKPDLGGHAAEVPDVGNGCGKFDVPHALAAHFGTRDFHAALFADDPLIADPLVFAAMAFPVLGGAEDLFAEQAVAFGFLGAVVDGLGLGDLAVRPFPDLFGRSNADLNGIEIV